MLAIRLALAAVFVFALVQSAQITREGALSVRILDAAGRPVAVRVRLEDAAGNRPKVTGALAVSESAIPIPKQAIAVMWGQQDRAEGYAIQPDGSEQQGQLGAHVERLLHDRLARAGGIERGA